MNIIIIIFIITNITPLFSLELSNTKHTVDFQKPIITEAPNDHITHEHLLEFTCKAIGNPKPSILWYNASTNQLIEEKLQTTGYQTSIHVNKHLGKLMISNPIPGKSYSVYCNASNPIGWTISDPPVIGAIVYLNDEFSVNPSDVEVDEGTSVTLECSPPKGLPKPQISWIKNNKTVINAGHVQNSYNSDMSNIEMMSNGNLRLNPVRMKDRGNYICVAKNSVGERLSQPANLRVKPLRQKSVTSKHVRVRQGQPVKLTCPISRNKSIKWSRKSKQLLAVSERIQQIKQDLIINHVMSSDSDVYICTTFNSEEGEIHLVVETSPTFIKSPVNLMVNIGDNVKFECIADGNPKPGIYWELPDRTPIFPTDNSSTQSTSSSSRHIVHTNGTLEINAVTSKDAGKYQCIAHSSIDMVQTSAMLKIKRRKKDFTTIPTITSTTILLNNHHENVKKLKTDSKTSNIVENLSKSTAYSISPYIGLPPSNKTQLIGESVLIDCELPRLVKIIHPNELETSHSKNYNHNNKSFTIQNTENWKVHWKRSILSHSEEIINEKADNRFKIFPTGSLQIIDLRANDSGQYTCSVIDETNINYAITVSLNVILSSKKKQGGLSDYLQDYPLSAPNNFQIMNKTHQSITLTWNPPLIYHAKNHDKLILSLNYWIELYTPVKVNEGWIIVERNWPVNIITLNGLDSNIPYYIIIRARLNEGRLGWASDPFGPLLTKTSQIYDKYSWRHSPNQHSFKPIELKNIQLNVLSSKTIHVSWNVVEQLSVLSQISGYIIYYRSVEHVKCLNNKYLQVNSNDPNFVNNYCSLNPENYRHHQHPHRSTRIHEIYNRLELMRQIYHEEQESNNITDSVTSLPGVISTVTIEAHYTQTIPGHKLSQPINHKVTSVLTELKPFRCYEIGIKAFHHTKEISMNYLETRDIFTHTALTYEASPISAPRNIFANWLFGESLELGWTAPPVSDWNGIILGYIVYIHDELLQTYHHLNVSSEGRKIVINLNALPKLFNVQLAAYTCIGIGVRSEALKIDISQRNFAQNRNNNNNNHNNKDLSVFITTENVQLSSSTLIVTNYSTNHDKLIHQPWFISAIISSLLAWCILFSMCILCWIRRHKFCKRKRLTYQLSQSNFQYTTTLDNGNCKSKLNYLDNKSTNLKHNGHLNNTSTIMMLGSVSSGEQTTFSTRTKHPQISYLPTNKQSSENNSNSSSRSYALQSTDYSDETRIIKSPCKLLDHFHTVNGITGNSANSSNNNINHTNSIVTQLSSTRQMTPNSPTNITYFPNDAQDPLKTNSTHFFTSASQTSSEPFDSAIYLEQIPNRQHFHNHNNHKNGSLGSIVLTSPTIMTSMNDDLNHCVNGQIYAPIVTPYATASIIPNENGDRRLQTSKQSIHFNENSTQNMYITCLDLGNCQAALNRTQTGGI
ncbi:unnamed protein product [Schistosoma turkestanicum]|nr:unnamed protein product [Schistosoma turkestanicum]